MRLSIPSAGTEKVYHQICGKLRILNVLETLTQEKAAQGKVWICSSSHADWVGGKCLDGAL